MNNKIIAGIFIVVLSVGKLNCALADLPYTLLGDSSARKLGGDVAPIEDLDSDEHPDFIVGSDGDGSNNRSRVEVRSGIDGDVIYTFEADAANEHFGVVVANAGDVDDDGTEDIIAGSSANYARVFSGADGSTIYTLTASSSEAFGTAVAGAGDVNNDGYDDVIVGDYLADCNDLTSNGKVHIFSGYTGAELFSKCGDYSQDRFGYSVTSVGDTNDDGYSDVLAIAYVPLGPLYNDSAYVKAVSGEDGSTLYTINLGWRGSFRVTRIGDVDSDGVADFLWAHATESSSPALEFSMHSGVSGSYIHSFEEDLMHPYRANAAGDINSDGIADIVVHVYRDPNQELRILSGVNGNVIAKKVIGAGSTWRPYGITDVDDDSDIDFAVGNPLDNTSYTAAGRVDVLSVSEFCINPDNLLLQNQTISGTEAFIAVETIKAGNNVDAGQTAGDFVIANGGNVTFEAGTSISLQPGFKVQSGGNFAATVGPIDNCT